MPHWITLLFDIRDYPLATVTVQRAPVACDYCRAIEQDDGLISTRIRRDGKTARAVLSFEDWIRDQIRRAALVPIGEYQFDAIKAGQPFQVQRPSISTATK